jgi:hypothetical protein
MEYLSYSTHFQAETMDFFLLLTLLRLEISSESLAVQIIKAVLEAAVLEAAEAGAAVVVAAVLVAAEAGAAVLMAAVLEAAEAGAAVLMAAVLGLGARP